MPKVNVYNLNGEVTSQVELSQEVFGADYNQALIHHVVVAHLANQRQGTRSTLTRTEVRGHSKKPYRQKGTGRARQGSTKAPHMIKGGVAHGPRPQDFSQKVNKQAKLLAFVSAISTKLAENELKIVENLDIAAPKTKEVVKVLENLKLDKNTIFVTDGKNEDLLQASANLQNVQVTTIDLLNTYEVVANQNVVMTLNAAKSLDACDCDCEECAEHCDKVEGGNK